MKGMDGKQTPETFIRRASTGDIGLIRSMAAIVFPDTYRDILSPAQLDYMMDWMYSPESLRRQMEQDGHNWFIAETGSRPSAYVSVQPLGLQEDGSHLFELQKLYVLPEFKGRGLGRLLYGHICDFVRSAAPGRTCRIELHVNRYNTAVDFYRHLGLEILRRGDFPIGQGYYMNDYIMGTSLQPM